MISKKSPMELSLEQHDTISSGMGSYSKIAIGSGDLKSNDLNIGGSWHRKSNDSVIKSCISDVPFIMVGKAS